MINSSEIFKQRVCPICRAPSGSNGKMVPLVHHYNRTTYVCLSHVRERGLENVREQLERLPVPFFFNRNAHESFCPRKYLVESPVRSRRREPCSVCTEPRESRVVGVDA